MAIVRNTPSPSLPQQATTNRTPQQNYAGDLSLPSTRLVLNTIHAVFPACRLFRDNPPAPERPSGPDFVNMVVFCAKRDGGAGRFAISFREPTEDDFRGSIARRSHLLPKVGLEIAFDWRGGGAHGAGGDVLRRGATGELERFQEGAAVSHWGIMRTVLPGRVWELW